MIDYNRLAIDTAKLSPCAKRKVGAVLVKQDLHAVGFNHNMATKDGGSCELSNGSTFDTVIHAEIAAIKAFRQKHKEVTPVAGTMYVTQPPCAKCSVELEELQIKVKVVEEFMKFDSEKLRYELIPTSATEGLAKVLTYGARKYKPNNWKKGELERYVGAAMRHLEAWRSGEKLDSESGLPHLEHLLTNVAFLIELDKTPSQD